MPDDKGGSAAGSPEKGSRAADSPVKDQCTFHLTFSFADPSKRATHVHLEFYYIHDNKRWPYDLALELDAQGRAEYTTPYPKVVEVRFCATHKELQMGHPACVLWRGGKFLSRVGGVLEGKRILMNRAKCVRRGKDTPPLTIKQIGFQQFDYLDQSSTVKWVKVVILHDGDDSPKTEVLPVNGGQATIGPGQGEKWNDVHQLSFEPVDKDFNWVGSPSPYVAKADDGMFFRSVQGITNANLINDHESQQDG